MNPRTSVPLTSSILHHPMSVGKAAIKFLDCFSGLHSAFPLQGDKTENLCILPHKTAKMRGPATSPHFAATRIHFSMARKWASWDLNAFSLRGTVVVTIKTSVHKQHFPVPVCLCLGARQLSDYLLCISD